MGVTFEIIDKSDNPNFAFDFNYKMKMLRK